MIGLRDAWQLIIRERRVPQSILRRGFSFGFCPVCNSKTLFIKRDSWLREHLLCIRCGSNPRWRALISALEEHFPDWREKEIHESSPCGSASEELERECKGYSSSQYFPDIPSGSSKDGVRCENLERLSFRDEAFDIIVSQDVFEHVPHPDKAFAEVARALKPGGAHIFTVPWNQAQKTSSRVAEGPEGLIFLAEPEYHGNPVDPDGSLVITEWGCDICDLIHEYSGMSTTIISSGNASQGIPDTFTEVFVSRKPS